MENTKLSWFGQHIWIGLDVHKVRWIVAILAAYSDWKIFSQEADVQTLLRYLHRTFPGATYHCVYEAGYCGFWICHQLREAGVDCIVINPADVPTTDKEKKHKTNRVDAKKLARSLRNGELKGIYLPSRIAQEDRTLVRSRHMFVCKQTRCKNQIKGLLAFYGISLPEDITERHWSARYVAWLESLRLESDSGTYAVKALLEELAHWRRSILQATRRIRRLARTDAYRVKVQNLTTISGISTSGAMVLLTEIVTVERFKTLDQLASFVGLIPGEASSGEERTLTEMTERRNPYLRWILTECAWVAVRYDESLALAFNELCSRMTKHRAIVRIARKILNRVRFVLKHDQPCLVLLKAA